MKESTIAMSKWDQKTGRSPRNSHPVSDVFAHVSRVT